MTLSPLWQAREKGNLMASIMDIASVEQAIAWQADHAAANGAPATGRVVRAQLPLLASGGAVGARMAAWPGKPLEDALPLRLAGGLHNLVLTGADMRLGAVYRGELTDQAAIDALVGDLVDRFATRLLPWLDGPPQTNEAGRSASIMAGLLWLSARVGPRFVLHELGASAGVNTMMDRFAFDLGGTQAGPADSPLHLAPEWRGTGRPPQVPVDVLAIAGCDRAPIDLVDLEQALRLKSYVWAEMTERIARLDAAIALAQARRPDLVAMDAADYVDAVLAAPQPEDSTRVIYHSIVWQYLPPATQARITAGIDAAGQRATMGRRLAWLSLETDRATFRHELTVRLWPDGGAPVCLAAAHAHGAWVEWLQP
ncbi:MULTISPECIES: DUF2332 domain-containing protein [unclassified Novosphingobium]|uniref:DUF2332 domain-containing protein n=1 Tax=unclassified Novosphingobium TaxID=2644732 RepID=UPI0017A624A6|nr:MULTISPECIES: DUF2332 domain-containing protein [unclassified Novosphingobium]MBB3359635.1 hypothetical protein [Novosphingobium sp. BK256]MBB3375999.1 hypothetical protein [Novosphingobium sp. BK280]MBB3380408.1 hypothetical protein [Novosphingobium sp. BK258]MBB3422060.1 hypothetical protein [Novosphingobium sp. BK267]MBB3450763.1 hypothetical protein [Novosphingobium sp. BK352]